MTNPIDPLRDTIADLMRWIAAEQLEATVIGGVAAGLQGQPRLTEDVDAVVLNAEADALLASGKQHGFEPRVAAVLEFSR